MAGSETFNFRIHRVARSFTDGYSIDFWISSTGRASGHARCIFDDRGFLPFEVSVSPEEVDELHGYFLQASSSTDTPAYTVSLARNELPREYKQISSHDSGPHTTRFLEGLEAICQTAIQAADCYYQANREAPSEIE